MKQNNTTHNSLAFIVIFAQCFGLLPVTGITENHHHLKFKWTSKRAFYSVFLLIIATINTILFVLNMIGRESQEFADWVTTLFFSATVTTVIIFLDIAKKWPILMKKWSEVDFAMSSYGFPDGLQRNLKVTAIVVMTAAIVEHGLFIAVVSTPCKGNDLSEIFESYFIKRFGYVFNMIPYYFLLGAIFQILNIFSTISWNFMDLFIILVSLCLSERFKQVTSKTKDLVKKQVTKKIVWQKLREDYTRLTMLCQDVDKALGNIIILSFANNLFVILVQLFYTLQVHSRFGPLRKLYYIYSFGFLIIRIIAVALFAARVNNESHKPKYYLITLSPCIWNIEIERLINQIKFNSPVLTGHRLFKITYTLILQITVAIVSYELVLLQYVRIKSA